MKDYENEYLLKDGETLIIRQPNVNDAHVLIDFMKTVDSETKFLAREPDEFNLTVEQESDFIEKSLDDENNQFLVAEINGEIVGNCSVGRVMNKRRYKHRASLGISVLKKHWNRGIGKKLMQACFKWCEK